MPRRTYTAAQKQAALDRLAANFGDVPLTAAQLGLAERTLYDWRKAAKIAHSALLRMLQSSPESPQPAADAAEPGVRASPPLYAVERGQGGEDASDLHALRDLIIRLSLRLGSSIEEAIPSAALPERIAAFTQVLDRAGKLGIRLPSEQIEYVLRVPGEMEEDLDREVNDYEDGQMDESTDSAQLPEACDSE
jgi:hypothetical protein